LAVNRIKQTKKLWSGIKLLLGSLASIPLTVHASEMSKQIIPDYFFSDIDSSENGFQNAVDELFDYYKYDIDTAGWCTSRINDSKDDDRSMDDTVRIALVDTVRGNTFVFPFKNYITSPFGPRGAYFHYGIDIKVVIGDSVRCALEGIVRVVQNDKSGFGRVIVVRHHNGLETIYGHLSKFLVKPNTRVFAGEVIGLGGNSGKSSGSHLHFEARYCGQPFDPLEIMNFEDYSLKDDTLALTTHHFSYAQDISSAMVHKVKMGETLSGIAKRYHISLTKLCSLNNITPTTVIKAGRTIIVRKNTEKLAQAGN
jgi:murein DD-endopeptidase MepM/ murein hydrolase activator NlpD